MERFKAGLHGSDHSVGVMIAYVQEPSLTSWLARINRRVRGLTHAGVKGWSHGDALIYGRRSGRHRTAHHRSVNARTGASPITLHRLWVEMTPAAVPAASGGG